MQFSNLRLARANQKTTITSNKTKKGQNTRGQNKPTNRDFTTTIPHQEALPLDSIGDTPNPIIIHSKGKEKGVASLPTPSFSDEKFTHRL